MIKTGIFSGSFNPIHIGHLALANWICEFEELDELWFMISPQNPLKRQEDLMEDNMRLEMVRSSIEDYPRFRASDFEFNLPRPSYTIDTLQALEKEYSNRNFSFIMGADNWVSFYRWKEHQKILDNYPILIYPRKDYEVIIPENVTNVKYVDAPLMEISSTFIRNSILNGKDIRFFLPTPIRRYFEMQNKEV